jgi:hypothetical protein
MGVVIEDEGYAAHEGYAARRLPGGTLTATWTHATREFDGYVAACGCGWHGDVDYLPTEYGEEFAIDQWRSEHAEPLLARQAEQRRLELAQALRALGGIADFVDNPANLARIGRAADRVRELVGDLQRDLDRRARAREAGRER